MLKKLRELTILVVDSIGFHILRSEVECVNITIDLLSYHLGNIVVVGRRLVGNYSVDDPTDDSNVCCSI
jgi:hypothetical protein